MEIPLLLRVPHRRTVSILLGIQVPTRSRPLPTAPLGTGLYASKKGWRMYGDLRNDNETSKGENEGQDSNAPEKFPSKEPKLVKASFGLDKDWKPLRPETSFSDRFGAGMESEQKEKTKEPEEDPDEFEEDQAPRPPRAVQAAYLCPLRRKAKYNIPVCDLQLRSYSARNLEFMADIALRAAYFLDLPANGPVALPRIIERWTVPKAHFIHKKTQENYERKTLRRLIQIKDGEPEVVRIWLGFLRKHAYYGVGMKANVWEFAGVDVAKDMDAALEQNRPEIESLLSQYAFKKGSKLGDELIDITHLENRWQASGGSAPMISTPIWRKPLN